MKDTRIFKFRVTYKYPFAKAKVGDVITPTGDEIQECLKFPTTFKDVTVQFEVLKSDENGQPIQVKRLKDGKVFSIGDRIYYNLNHLKQTITFIITGFQPSDNDTEMWLCYNSNKHNDKTARACGIRKGEHLKRKKKGVVYEELA